jgi:hypothetical protein
VLVGLRCAPHQATVDLCNRLGHAQPATHERSPKATVR